MRIECIEVSGLRSHRGNPPTVLDLSDKSLVAIVGHTGAGKSSLLEAVTFAFFGEATYGGKAYGELSSDGRTEISVRMTFTVGGDRYQLVRVVAPNRNGVFGAKETWLRRVDPSGNPLTHIDGVRNVDAAVSTLLGGMSREQFCQAVLLVQNRFAALLEADPRIRNTLLDALLGLAALDKAREGLRAVRKAAQRNIERVDGDRKRLSLDPAGDLRHAKASVEAMTAVADSAEAVAVRLLELATTAATLGAEADELARLAALRVSNAAPDGPTQIATLSATLAELNNLDELLAGDARDAEANAKAAASRLEVVERDLVNVQKAHGAAGRHRIIAERLAQLSSRLSDRAGQEASRAAAIDKAEALRQDLVRAASDAVRCAELVTARKQEEQKARDDHRSKLGALKDADQAIAAVAAAAGRLAVPVGHLHAAAAALAGAEAAVADADAALGPLLQREEAASSVLAATRRANAAAAASHDCHVGEPCPICGTALPQGWAAPGGGDLAAATEAFKRAEQAVKEASEARRSATERLVSALTNLRASLSAVCDAHTEVRKTAGAGQLDGVPALPTDLHTLEGAPTDILRSASDAAAGLLTEVEAWVESRRGLLEPARTDVDAAELLAVQALEVLTAAEADKAKAASALRDLETAIAVEGSRCQAADEALLATERRITSTLEGIDERWRALITLDGATLLDDATATLAADEALVDAAVAAQRDALAACVAADHQVAAIAAERAQRVDRGVAAARVGLVTITEMVNDLASRLHQPEEAAPEATSSASQLLAHARELLERARRLSVVGVARATGLQAQVAELQEPGSHAVAVLVEAMNRADPDDQQLGARPDGADPFAAVTRDRVQQIVGAARRLVTEAARAADKAAEEVRTAAALDHRVQDLTSWRADLDGAIEVLKKENFPAWARTLRMADLVATASELLAEMTNGRYRFGPSLLISDDIAGIVRKASTLSGGEKFEASLALALSVSEIAGRSGVRVDTLFLDEGFAGLDQAHLNRALDALENQVEAGRCIVLITHIGSVADRIKDVLLIEPDGAGGSTTRWLNEEERFELGADLDLAVP
jgi:exonuclease SbcC